ncbi:MAG: LVIVD repeat-containing protein [Chitinophagaceae bacterium]
MNKRLTVEIASFLLITVLLGMTACVKDNCKERHTYTFYEAVYKTKAAVRENIKSNTPRLVENPGKINTLGSYIFLNEIDKGIHVIDNANPSQPKNIAFIEIPGNVDMAVKGNTLYADLYTDLVAIDITNPANVKLAKVIESVFPYRYWGNGFVGTSNSDQVITDWVKRDTTVTESCERQGWLFTGRADVFFAAQSNSSPTSKSPVGTGGSMARFTIMNDRLYTVGTSDLDVFNITTANDPRHTNRLNVGWNIETIYPFKNRLFIGSQTGMFIYNVSNADAPVAAGQFNHVSTCDPVIADDVYAYVTLRSGTSCGGFTNQLDIVKLNNITDPVLQKTYPMKNPHGLSKDGNLLFICDGEDGLKLYNASDVMNLQLLEELGDINAYDVIAMNKIALVVAKDGLYQYSYANPADIRLLSKIAVGK